MKFEGVNKMGKPPSRSPEAQQAFEDAKAIATGEKDFSDLRATGDDRIAEANRLLAEVSARKKPLQKNIRGGSLPPWVRGSTALEKRQTPEDQS